MLTDLLAKTASKMTYPVLSDCSNLLIFTDINECSSSPCKYNGTCEDQVNSYICLCLDGYEELNCSTNTDDCMNNPCLNGGTCEDDVNGYQCTCVTGYSGDSCGIGMFTNYIYASHICHD